MEKEPRPPGLRLQGKRLIWRASKEAVAKGYPVKSANLTMHADNPGILRERCVKLQREMIEWLTAGSARRADEFNGTFKSVFDLYQNDPTSPFPKLKPGTQQPYETYLRMMRAEIGHCHLNRTDGRDVQEWFDAWAAPAKPGEPRMLAKARMAMSVLKAALSFAIMCRKPGCAEFRACIPKRFAMPKSRKFALTADQIIAARTAAREIQHPGAALAYAMQFEGAARQWDIVGVWVPLSDPRPSAIHYKRKKWIGPTWANVDQNLILRWTPTKTEDSSGETVTIDLSACPMVMEELEMIDLKTVSGPLIVDRNTGRPYQARKFEETWHAVREAAGLPAKVWNRDLRKSGSTEARRGGAQIDDLKKVMGHAAETDVTGKVYDLADLEAHRRVIGSRIEFRNKKPAK